MAKNETLATIDKQIIAWVEQLDILYKQREEVSDRIAAIESRLSSLKLARRALALEWGDDTKEVPIPLQYTSEGVTEAIHGIFEGGGRLTVDQIVYDLLERGYNFGKKNPRRVVNMALINDPEINTDGDGSYYLGRRI